MTVVKAREWGIVPEKFCQNELYELLENVSDDTVIEFEEGNYFIDATVLPKEMWYITNTAGDEEYKKGETPHLSCSPIVLKNKKNVTLDGNGAKFIIHGKATNCIISKCEGITLKNFAITVQNPESHELKVVNMGKYFVDYKIDSETEYEKIENNFYFTGKDYKRSFMEKARWSWWNAHFPADEPEKCYRDNNPLRKNIKLKEIAPHTIRAYYFKKPNVKTGDKIYLYDVRRQYAGIFVEDSKNITLENVKQHFNYSLAFVAQNTENITLDKVYFAPEKDKERVFASCADFIQICMCRGLVTVKDSFFSGAGDDCMNVHGFHFKVKDVTDNTLTVGFMHSQSHGFLPFNEGDKITFVNGKTMLENGEAIVEKAELLTEYNILLTLDREPQVKVGEFVENITACPDVEFVNNEISNIVTRGLLLTTRGNVNIENNHFRSNCMSGILLSDDANAWFESGACHSMTIKNNRFDYCGENGILIKPENTKHEGAVHKNIIITDNVFKKCEREAFYVKSSENIVIKNNRVDEAPKMLYTENVANLVSDI